MNSRQRRNKKRNELQKIWKTAQRDKGNRGVSAKALAESIARIAYNEEQQNQISNDVSAPG